ncbi:MAG: hypothetical protein Q7J27_11765 [Syntrophales bacterium]|nr:hypothetical protein [Syntrophales bacterium]
MKKEKQMAQTPDEKTYVEISFIEQLKALGWEHIGGDIDVPYLTERESFRDVLLVDRLRNVVRRINLNDNGNPWLDDDRVNQVVSSLERISAPKLMEANKKAFDLIVHGVEVEGDPADSEITDFQIRPSGKREINDCRMACVFPLHLYITSAGIRQPWKGIDT